MDRNLIEENKQLLIVNISKENVIMDVYEDGKLIKKIEDVWIGKNGYTSFKDAIDFDEKTPLGFYNLGVGFGMSDMDIDYPYIKVQDNDYWVDDYKSYHYNYMVRVGEDIPNFGYHYIVREDEKSFDSAEHLRDFEMQYEYAVFIEFNSDNQIDENGVGNNKGSAIFLHCHGTKGYTGGCVAVNREDMEFIMRFLKRDKNPKILIREI